MFNEPSAPFTRGWLSKLTSGGLTVPKLSGEQLETVIGEPKYRLVLSPSPPAVGLTALGPLLMSHPCWIPNTVLTPVTEQIDVRAYFTKVTKQPPFFSITAVTLCKEERQSDMLLVGATFGNCPSTN